MNGLGGSERTNALADLHDEFLAQSIIDLVAILDGNESVDSLAGEFISNTDDGSLTDSGVLNEGSFDFGGGETVATDVDNIIDTAADPVEAFVVTGSAITSELVFVSTNCIAESRVMA